MNALNAILRVIKFILHVSMLPLYLYFRKATLSFSFNFWRGGVEGD